MFSRFLRHLGLGAVFVISCTPQGPDLKIRTEIVVLTDLSGTWHNQEMLGYNHSLLKEVDEAISSALQTTIMQPMYQISIYEIGASSFNLAAICQHLYQPALIGREGVYTNERDLATAQDECRNITLNKPQAKLTDITAAIDTVARSRVSTQTRYVVIVLSDFEEDRGSVITQEGIETIGDLSGMDFILLYRAVNTESISRIDARMEEWRSKLEGKGARIVLQLPDSRAKRDTISPFIGLEHKKNG